MTVRKVKPMVAHNLRWVALIFCYQWMAWGLIGVIGSLWPSDIIHLFGSMPRWLLAVVFWGFVYFGPLTGYFLLAFHLDFCRRISIELRIALCLFAAGLLTGLTSVIILNLLLATGRFPFMELHSLGGGA